MGAGHFRPGTKIMDFSYGQGLETRDGEQGWGMDVSGTLNQSLQHFVHVPARRADDAHPGYECPHLYILIRADFFSTLERAFLYCAHSVYHTLIQPRIVKSLTTKEIGMQKLSCLAVIVVLAVCADSCSGGLPAVKGSAWLSRKAIEPPELSISGNWNSPSWSLVIIKQEGAELSGNGDGWPMKGVVSGKTAYLVFFNETQEKVFYRAELEPGQNNTLVGHYSKYALIGEKGAKKTAMTLVGGPIKE